MANNWETWQYIFCPRSVAVLGASSNPFKMGHQCLLSLKDSNFPNPIFPINPQEKEILGWKTYARLEQVPGTIDLAIISIPAAEVMGALKACQEKGVKGAVIITAGFREIENEVGTKLQQEMAELANQGGIKIIGPNTFGMVNIHAQLNASFTPLFSRLKPGPISVLSQSGGVAHLIAYQAIDEQVGLGKVVGLGNRCNVDFVDLLPFFGNDECTKVLILFTEGVDQARLLWEGVNKFTRQKPIVVMKGGRNEFSWKAARSHTGSMAGRYELYEAALKQAGALVVNDPRELLDLAKVLAMISTFEGKRVAVMSFQAGPGILITDAVIAYGLEMASFTEETQKKLSTILPPLTIRTNPIDLAFARREELFTEVLKVVLNDPQVDALIIFLLHHPFMDPRRISHPLLVQKKCTAKPIFLCLNSPRGLVEEEVKHLEEEGIPVFAFPEQTIKALKGLLQLAEIKRRREESTCPKLWRE
ncbi:MAG: acetate--CoA ligase family protein [Thermodesulfobacteriota bacterium]